MNQKDTYETSLLESIPLANKLTCRGFELILSKLCEITEPFNINKENILIQSASRF